MIDEVTCYRDAEMVIVSGDGFVLALVLVVIGIIGLVYLLFRKENENEQT